MKEILEFIKNMFFDVLVEYGRRSKIFLFLTLLVGTFVAVLTAEVIDYSIAFEAVISVFTVYGLTILSYVIYNRLNVVRIEFYYINGQAIKINDKSYINLVSLWGAKKIIFNKDELNLNKVFKDLIELFKEFDSTKEVHYFSITSIPINGYIGYNLGRFRKVYLYNFNQEKSQWDNIEKYKTVYPHNIEEHNKESQTNQCNLIISLSNEIRFEHLINKELYTYSISYETTNEKQDIEYDIVFNSIKSILLDHETCHIYLSSNSAFAVYLGTKLYNRNYCKPVWYEWGGNNEPRYTQYLDTYKGEVVMIGSSSHEQVSKEL